MVEFHIDQVYPKGKAYPLIVNFQNGYPRENFQEQECTVLEHKIKGKKIVATEINQFLYTGEECEEPVGKTLLLARNRVTGKVRLIEVENIEVQPLLRNDIDTDAQETSFIELGRKFGSKKYKQILEQTEKLKVSQEVVTEQLKNVSQNVSQDQLDLSSYTKSDSDEFYIPPMNREATDIKDVYMLNAILTEDQYDSIYSELEDTDYAKDFAPLIKEIYSEKWNKEQTVLALYASTLLKLNNMVMKVISVKSFIACPYSLVLNNIILKEFFVSGKTQIRGRPAQYKDKALCHAIVFMLLLNNYKLDIELLCKHLKVVEKTANQKIALTGAWSIKVGNKKIAILKLPLNKASKKLVRRKSTRF